MSLGGRGIQSSPPDIIPQYVFTLLQKKQFKITSQHLLRAYLAWLKSEVTIGLYSRCIAIKAPVYALRRSRS